MARPRHNVQPMQRYSSTSNSWAIQRSDQGGWQFVVVWKWWWWHWTMARWAKSTWGVSFESRLKRDGVAAGALSNASARIVSHLKTAPTLTKRAGTSNEPVRCHGATVPRAWVAGPLVLGTAKERVGGE
jgi:hypothetical protein